MPPKKTTPISVKGAMVRPIEVTASLLSRLWRYGPGEADVTTLYGTMTEAGADVIVCHLGLTTGGDIGADTAKTLDDCADYINAWSEAALKKRRDVIILCHGGPISMPADAEYVLKRCPDCNGFYGASSMERLPTEKALTAQTKEFLNIKRS